MNVSHRILVTGGAGFIGANFVRYLLANDPHAYVVNLDLLTYAGSLNNLKDLPAGDRHTFVQGDVADRSLVTRLFDDYDFDSVVHLAAESHVDRSISEPAAFIQTNIVGTFTLLEAARDAWEGRYEHCRFVQVSTDEVYGALGPHDPPFDETTPYAPNSPYSASKASSDHLVRAYYHTYGLPAITTNCSNNYGPYQYPEKLIPLTVLNALTGKALPVYGDGQQVRDWLYVEDHCRGLFTVLNQGRLGETYAIGGSCERANLDLVRTICGILDQCQPRPDGRSYREQITHVRDRPGHDRRYAIDSAKIRAELDWAPTESLNTGLEKTIRWYLDNEEWVNTVLGENYDRWIELNYADRSEVETK